MMPRAFHPRRSRARGQAAVEYTIILVLVMSALLADPDGTGSPLALTVQALKDFFSAYSWAISFSTTLTAL